MLSPEERQEIEEEVRRYPERKATSIDALKIVQRRRGWVSDDAIRDIAEFLGMSEDDLDGIATFFNMVHRRPVGRHVIYICDSVSCWIVGYEKLLQAITGRLGIRLGETSADGRFTLLPIQCLGNCEHAPAMMIDEDLYRDLDPAGVGEVLEKYR